MGREGRCRRRHRLLTHLVVALVVAMGLWAPDASSSCTRSRSRTSIRPISPADGLIEQYFPVADALEAKIARIEDRLYKSFDPGLLREIVTLL